jgi:hypothetical protein
MIGLNVSPLGELASDASSWLRSAIAHAAAWQDVWLLYEATFRIPDLES